MSQSQKTENSENISQLVMQQAVLKLAEWVEIELPLQVKEHQAIVNAKELLLWDDSAEIKPLRLLFDFIQLEDKTKQETQHYSPAISIDNQQPTIPSPQTSLPDLNNLKQEIKQELSNLEAEDFDNLPLLTLLVEKFGSHLSYGEDNIAFTDLVKSTAAVASALNNNLDTDKLCLIAGDLSGIQKFIYTISADGALKSLRARSFFLELVTEEIVQQLLTELELPLTNVIYAGGGNLYILSDGDEEKNSKIVKEIRHRFNDWLRRSFQGKLFLALDYLMLPKSALSTAKLSDFWKQIPQKLAQQKQRKFDNQLSDFLAPQPSYEPCKVCHRDDQKRLKPLNKDEPDSSSACWVCRTMFELGSKLFKAKAIVRVKRAKNRSIEQKDRVNKIVVPGYEYYLYENINKALSNRQAKTIFLINNWDLSNYKNSKVKPILLGNYAKKTEIEKDERNLGFMSASEMAAEAQKSGAIPRVGYLRMDVDNLGKIFAQGLGEKQNLVRLAGLSRQMTYFFKVYLNSLAKQKKDCNLLFIYAGGDDLFISGAWHELVEFAFDINQSFRAYTGYNPSVTLSGGISLANSKYPLYQSAQESGEAEEEAKGNGKDSFSLFGEVFTWYEWLGEENVSLNKLDFIPSEIKEYLGEDINIKLFGVKPFVTYLQTIEVNYSQNFIRNLLVTAKIQEQKIADLKKKRKPQIYAEEINDITYYLHLPKIAYTLARLPTHIKNNPEFEPISTSLKSTYNARYYKAIATWLELLNRSK